MIYLKREDPQAKNFPTNHYNLPKENEICYYKSIKSNNALQMNDKTITFFPHNLNQKISIRFKQRLRYTQRQRL